MWEIRNDPRHHTTSLLMCWVAIERMMRVARQRGLPGELSRWAEVRDEIYHRIMADHWDEEVGAFMQRAGSDTLEPAYAADADGEVPLPSDPRFLSTLAAIEEPAGLRQPGLPLRPRPHPPTAWTVSRALSRCAPSGTSRRSPAPVGSTTPGWRWRRCSPSPTTSGLYAEQIGLTGEQLGNFPQAFTHLALISAASISTAAGLTPTASDSRRAS